MFHAQRLAIFRKLIVPAVVSAGALFLPTTTEAAELTGNAQAGHEVALISCTGCHVVASDQPFKPVYPAKLPDFNTIANKPNTTAASLQHFLETLPEVPKRGQMGDPLLSRQDLRNVVAYILSLRNVSHKAENARH
jgi:mono/diheme cytochrome c family protein